MKRVIIVVQVVLISCILNGQNYFQQKVNHHIEVTLNDDEKSLDGYIQTLYINNSPDTLSYIYYHFWPNAYKNTNTAYAKQQLLLRNSSFQYADDYYRGYINNLNFIVDGEIAELKDLNGYEDVNLLILPKPLLPGDTTIIETKFFVKIPLLSSRLGYEDNDFCITQWYPKPAVYDVDGWHPMSYLDMGEFYSEFGDFEVSITLPDDYIVAATGNLLSRTELTKLEDYASMCKSAKSKKNIRPFGDSTKQKTITYIERNIHDFAWFASKDFLVDRKNVKLSESGKHITCWSFYHKDNWRLWEESVDYVGNTIVFLSEIVGEYPYQNCSAVDGPLGAGGGMEYPTITVVKSSTKRNLERVITHEVIHNWFYGILASNERNSPWIDEGFTSFYESKYFDKYYPEKSIISETIERDFEIHGLDKIPSRFSRELSWNYLISENFIQDGSLNSEEMSPINYFILSYNKPVSSLYALEMYLGESEYRSMMQSFYEKYHHHHIYPSSLRNHFESYTGTSLSWFFDDFILTNKIPDYKLCRQVGDSVLVKNVGEAKAPLFLYVDDSLSVVDGFSGKRKFYNPERKKIAIDKDYRSLDVNRNNNYLNPGIFKLNKPIKVSFANFMDNPEVSELPFLPIVGFNVTDGWMPGIILYTPPIPKKSFEMQLMPMYGTRTNSLTGFGNISYFAHPNIKSIREVELYTSARLFGIDKEASKEYFRADAGVNLRFKTSPKQKRVSELTIRNIAASDYYSDTTKYYQNLKYLWADYKAINPNSLAINIERGQGFVKAGIEFVQKINYNEKIGLKIRFFGGKFLYSSDEYYGNYNFRLSGNIGTQDYLYDDLYVGRNEDIRYNPESFWSHQFMRNDGGFTLYTPYGQSSDWLVALNIDSETPLRVVDIYFNAGVCPVNVGESGVDLYHEVGIKFTVLNDFLSIYFPIFGTNKVWQASNDIYTDNYLQKIRFTLSLEKINLLYYRNKPYLLF